MCFSVTLRDSPLVRFGKVEPISPACHRVTRTGGIVCVLLKNSRRVAQTQVALLLPGASDLPSVILSVLSLEGTERVSSSTGLWCGKWEAGSVCLQGSCHHTPQEHFLTLVIMGRKSDPASFALTLPPPVPSLAKHSPVFRGTGLPIPCPGRLGLRVRAGLGCAAAQPW